MTNEEKLRTLFTSSALIKVIKYFLNREFGYVRLIERETGVQINSVRREIKRLSDLGLVYVFKKDNSKIILAWNDASALSKPIKKIFNG